MSKYTGVAGSSMEYTEAQQDRIEPTAAGQAIPYEDYSVAAGATTEDEEGDERVVMRQQHSKPPHQKKHQQQRPSSRKRSISSSSSDSSRSSSSSSILSSSSSDDSGSDGGDARVATVKKKKRRKKTTGDGKRKVGGKQQQKATEPTTNDDGSINKLISVALRSQKKQYKNQIIQSVKSDLMNTLRSRIVQHQQRGKKKNSSGGGDDEEGNNDDVDATADTTTDKQYRKRIKQAYRELEEGHDDAPKFNSKQHKKAIGSILSKLGEVNDIELYRIPHIDKEMGFDRMDIGVGDIKLNKKMLSASPDKTIPEAVYAALKDAYSSCMLYKYFFRRIYPYLTVPYISK